LLFVSMRVVGSASSVSVLSLQWERLACSPAQPTTSHEEQPNTTSSRQTSKQQQHNAHAHSSSSMGAFASLLGAKDGTNTAASTGKQQQHTGLSQLASSSDETNSRRDKPQQRDRRATHNKGTGAHECVFTWMLALYGGGWLCVVRCSSTVAACSSPLVAAAAAPSSSSFASLRMMAHASN
jgi:hypothetical protein